MSETTEQWCVFSDDPEDGMVLISEDLADVEEMAPLVLAAGIARRVVRTSDWVRQERCSGCGSVLDGELCCDGRRAEVEAGEAVLAAASEPLVCTCTPTMRSAGRRCEGCVADDASPPVSPGEATAPTSQLPGRHLWASEDDGRLLFSLIHNGREWGQPGASSDVGTLNFYRHAAGLFLSKRAAGSPVAETPAEPAELPSTLRSVDDVRQVCEHAGLVALGSSHVAWADSAVGVSASANVVGLALVRRQGGRHAVVANVFDGSPSWLLLAAIRAAHGESDDASEDVRQESFAFHSDPRERPSAASGRIVPGDWRYLRLAEIAHAALFYEDDDDGPIFRWSDRRLASDDDGLLKCAADATAGAVWNNRAEIIALLAAPTPGESGPAAASPAVEGTTPTDTRPDATDGSEVPHSEQTANTAAAHPGVARLLARCDEIDAAGYLPWDEKVVSTDEVRALLAGGDPT